MELTTVKTTAIPAPVLPIAPARKKKPASRMETSAKYFFLACAWISAAAIAMIFGFLLFQGMPAIQKIGLVSFVTGLKWSPSAGAFGILPMIAGTLLAAGLGVLIAVPSGILAAMFLHGFCPDKLKKSLGSLVALMAGIPSVVYGFFGLTVIVPLIRMNFGGAGTSLLACGLLLAMMILPTIISVSKTSLDAVDPSVYEGSRGLGASHEQSLFSAVLPAAKRGVLSSVILGLGRAAGETMAVVMIAGNQPVLPNSLFDGIRTLSANIVMEMGYAADLHLQALSASAVILLVIVLLINLVFSLVSAKKEHAA